MNILADASLPGLKAAFPRPFNLSTYSSEEALSTLFKGQEVLLCRSTLKVTENVLQNHSLKYLATASSGTDHLDRAYLNAQAIQVIDAKGSNATSVVDYVQSCLAYLDKHHLIKGSKVGIIGMGKVGSALYSRLKSIAFQVAPFDPLKNDCQSFISCSQEELYTCDILCIHAELHNNNPYPSFNLINQDFLAQLQPGCILINASRGGIVNEEALLAHKGNLIYCTDVYLNEPQINRAIIQKATLCTPHIAGHSLEAKYAAIAQISEQLHKAIGLPLPHYESPVCPRDVMVQEPKSWQELALSLYNPEEETLCLKQAQNIPSSYISLRKKHQNRHDFATYPGFSQFLK
ncbi:MAG: 4-phosphoerythronate dehydrogenase [Legionellales bacterium]